MGGNFSVRREIALRLGGFDERFVRVAYHFEAEFAYRLNRAGHRIFYEPAASLHHLRAREGGTRVFGDHLRSYRPNHSVGSYYYTLRKGLCWKSAIRFLGRPVKAIATRHHLRNPWWIPATLVAEFTGMAWALVLAAQGPRYLSPEEWLKDRGPGGWIGHIAARYWRFLRFLGVAFRTVVMSCYCHPAGSPEKAYPRPARFFCCVCGSGVWGGLRRGVGPGSTVVSEKFIWTIPAACHAFLDLAVAGRRASIQFLFAFRQPDDTADRVTDIRAAIYLDRLRVSACFSRWRSLY